MTHLLKSLLNGNLLALVAFTAALTPQALKAADADGQCPLQNATLLGTYMSSGTGTIVGVGPIAAVGTITYDGKGNSVNTYTVSVNGAISRGVTVTGPYTVNRDCTGTLAQSDGLNYDFVVAPDGSTVRWIQTNTGIVLSGTQLRFRHSSEKAAAADAKLEKMSTEPFPSLSSNSRHGFISDSKDKGRRDRRDAHRRWQDFAIADMAEC
jgi:hypothetical protein